MRKGGEMQEWYITVILLEEGKGKEEKMYTNRCSKFT